MPGHTGRQQYKKNNYNNHKKDQRPIIIDENNPVLKAFQSYAIELDAKHDRYERIVKMSRDITIESKRIIFLLHSIDVRKNNKQKVLEEARTRLEKVIACNFKAIAEELHGHDPYQFRGAYSPGLQEFIEAYTFMEYIKYVENDSEGAGGDEGGEMSDWNALQKKMTYPASEEKEVKDEEEITTSSKASTMFFVDPNEYILGVSDLTGELMRRCINSLCSGETDTTMACCKALQKFFTGYISLNVHRCRELSRKIYTMRQSVLKAENVCYNVKVRGGEAAKWGAMFDSKSIADDIDEGFF
ncbi:translin-associated protein X [Musca vetustissima]|uniref:translin-associated protein X n=1 Tax=Musca vetustissima TaxID=27455 RepID=UPI002AB5FB9F|nr:translin-associated protein X [Musca vetustissima]